MKLNRFGIILLFLSLLLFTSCNRSQSYYRSGRYEKALEAVEKKESPGKGDYLIKAQSLVKLGRPDEARESILLYLIMTDEDDDREFATDLFVDLNFSDILNILLLKPEDGIKPQIALYKSYTALGETQSALEILELLTKTLNFRDFTTLIVNFPCSADYNALIFQAWQQNMNEDDISAFASLFLEFSNYSGLTEDASKSLISTGEAAINSKLFSQNPILLSRIHKAVGFALASLHDIYNANRYFSEALRLDPTDQELAEIMKGFDYDQV